MLIFRWFLVQVLTEKASLRAVLKKTVSLKSSPEGERLMKTLHSTFLKGHGEEEEALYLYSLFLFYISCQKFYILIDLTFMPNSSFSPFPVTLSPSLLFPFHSTGPCPSSSSSSLAITSVSYAIMNIISGCGDTEISDLKVVQVISFSLHFSFLLGIW